MDRWSPDPEPVEIVLVPVGDGADGAGRERPPPAGAGTLPPVGGLVAAAAARIVAVPDPPLGPDRHQRQPWADRRVHRLVRLAPGDADGALCSVVAAWDGHADRASTIGPRRRPWPRPPRATRLTFTHEPRDRSALHPAVLRVRRWRRAVPVDVVLVPWSARRSQLVLVPHRRRPGARLPRRYYDAAHLVMDEVWHRVERGAPAARPADVITTRRRP